MVTLRSLDDQIQFHIEEGQNLILGRLMKCDLVLDDTSVSSQHARLQLKESSLRVVDMNSTNGTRVNYAVLSGPGYLLDGDTVEFGNVSFVVDGPKLEVPHSEERGRALAEMNPLEASQQMAATMVNIQVPSDEELAHQTGRREPGADGTETSQAPETPKSELKGDPQWYAFMVALGLIVLSGILMAMYLWTYSSGS